MTRFFGLRWLVLWTLAAGSLWFLLGTAVTHAGPLTQSNGHDPRSSCMMCHANPDLKGQFQDGSLVSLYVDENEYQHSVHGPAGLECVACHTDISGYPHHEDQLTCNECHKGDGDGAVAEYTTMRVQLSFENAREMVLSINEACRSCHEEEFAVAGDSAHVKVLASGNLSAPVCVDCHGGHDIPKPDEPRTRVSQTCAKCHQSVYSSYKSSVHGAALEGEGNLDVPACIDCHGVHSVRGPRESGFRNDSIAICGSCHGDKELMASYDISTEVMDTYLNDFHGRTVDLFRRQQNGISSNKAVCFDCHGIHNIQAPDDPTSTVYPENLQHTCQQCHKDANIRFPQAWLGHFLPTWEDTPVLYAVNTTYRILISMTVGGFLMYIGLDARKRWQERKDLVMQALAEDEFDEYDFTEEF